MDLVRLNELMFQTEAQPDVQGTAWEKFLGNVLADDFHLRRSNPAKPLEDKATFLAATRASEPSSRVKPVSSIATSAIPRDRQASARGFRTLTTARLSLPAAAGNGV